MNKLVLVAVVLIVALGGYFFLTARPTQSPAPTVTPVSAQATPTPEASGDAMMGEERVIEVAGDPFSFTPNVIRVKKGEKVAVNFTNVEGFHDFVIDELEVKTAVLPQGTSEKVTIPTDEVGTYEFYCSVADHRAQGMIGQLIIEE